MDSIYTSKNINTKMIYTNELFHHYIVGDCDSSQMNFLLEKTGIEFSHRYFYIATFQLSNPKLKAVDLHEINNFNTTSKVILNHIKETSPSPVWFYKINYRNILIIINSDDSTKEIETYFNGVYNWVKDSFNLDSSWGISLPCGNIEDLWLASHQAVISTNTITKGKIHAYHGSLAYADEQIYYPASLENILITSIKNNDIACMDCIIQVLYDENFIVHDIGFKQLGILNAHIINSLYHFHSIKKNFTDLFICLNQCVTNNASDYNEYFEQLTQICHKISASINQNKTCQKNTLITQITKFIKNNYKDSNLCLSMIAEKFHISDSYLSSIFKNQMNTGFTEYVEKLRIEAACNLLKTTNKSISYISLQVGYNSVYSFRRAFKRTMNIGPSDYRNGL